MAAHPVLCAMRTPAEAELERVQTRYPEFEPAMMQFLLVNYVPDHALVLNGVHKRSAWCVSPCVMRC